MRSVKQVKHLSDPRLTCVTTRYKQLRRELSDAEWDDDPCADLIRTEYQRYEALLKQGTLYEPNF